MSGPFWKFITKLELEQEKCYLIKEGKLTEPDRGSIGLGDVNCDVHEFKVVAKI